MTKELASFPEGSLSTAPVQLILLLCIEQHILLFLVALLDGCQAASLEVALLHSRRRNGWFGLLRLDVLHPSVEHCPEQDNRDRSGAVSIICKRERSQRSKMRDEIRRLIEVGYEKIWKCHLRNRARRCV